MGQVTVPSMQERLKMRKQMERQNQWLEMQAEFCSKNATWTAESIGRVHRGGIIES